ncbi:MAG: site-specific integrase, partial [Chloroflexales bacterium]|nr:site-specific integrase [Chloroflexales bacterium]
ARAERGVSSISPSWPISSERATMGKRRKREKRRPNQDGSVFEFPEKSGQWWAQLPAGADGRRPKRKAKSKTDAAKILREMQAERAKGRDLRRQSQTVADLLQHHLDTISPQLRGATIKAKRTKAAHITRHIGALAVDKVSVETIQKLANTLSETLSPQTVKPILALLRRAYKPLIPTRVLYNPVDWDLLTLATPRPTPYEALDDATIRCLLRAAEDSDARGGDHRFALAWRLALCLGLRRGELLTLHWADIDWDKAELRIRVTNSDHEDGGVVVLPPKTPAGVRTLPIGPRLLERLRSHWELVQAERRFYGPRYIEHGRVLAQPDGTPYAQTDLNNALNRLCRDADLPHCTPHLLRHSCATLLADLGYAEAVIAGLLGHERRGSVTIRYTHARKDTLRRAVAAIETHLFAASSAFEVSQ